MSRAINLGSMDSAALRSLMGFRCLTAAGCAVNSTTNTYTITIGGTVQTDDIITVTVLAEAGSVSGAFTITATEDTEAKVATALELVVEALTGVASSATGAVITVTPATTTEAITVTAAVTKASGTPTTTATVAQTVLGAKGVKTANTIQFIVDGHNGSQTTQTNVAIGGSVIPVSSFRWYLLSIGTTGTVTATAGVTDEDMLPELPSNQAPIGAVKIATDSTHTFTPGTTGLNATGITDTYFDLSCVPEAGYPA